MKSLLLILTTISIINLAFSKPVYVVSSYPAKMILQEIVGDKIEIFTLLPVGSSPHTFTPKPSQMKKVKEADCFFYIADNLDAWANKISAKKKIKMMDLVPKNQWIYFDEATHEHEHHHGHKHSHGKKDLDPHFWTSPLTVKAMLPNLLTKLNQINPMFKDTFSFNANKFIKKLDELDKIIKAKLLKYKGENIFLFHPSFLYFIKHYGLNYAGSIETSPGKEPSSKSTINLVNRIKKAKAKAIYSEPQLPEAPAKAIAEASGLKIYFLDPVGGTKGKKNYYDFIVYNTHTFHKSFERNE